MSIQHDADKSMDKQNTFAKDIGILWNAEMRQDYRVKDGIKKTDMYMPLDYIVTQKNKSKVLAYAELKCRDIRSDKYESLILDHSKMNHIRHQYELTGIPIFVCVRFTDGDRFYKYESNHFKDENGNFKVDVYFTGRTTQTRSEYDYRQCEYIPLKYFKVFTPSGAYVSL